MTDPIAVRETAGRARRGRRVRVVLAERRTRPGVVRTRTDVEEQTGVGDVLLRQLMTAQLALAVRLATLTVTLLGAIPAMFYLAPQLGTVGVLGVRVPWALLGVAVYPLMVAVGWAYVRGAERHERQFAEMVENSSTVP